MEYKNEQDETIRKRVLQVYENNRDTLIQAYNIKCEVLDEPNRENKVYEDIETPYKHTYSLAFEIAIRNNEVKKILYALRYLKNIKKNYNENKKIYLEELLIKYPYYLDNDLHNHFLSIGLLRINDLIEQFEDNLRETYLIIPKENLVTTPESSKVLVQRIIHNSPKLLEGESVSNETSYKFEEQVHDDYTITSGILEGEETFDIGIIRPTYNSHIVDNNTFDIPINLSLPTEEIVAFIEKIKENSELIKSPLELLGKELESIDPENVEEYLPKSFNGKLVSMANALFTYDSFQYLTNKQKQLEIKKNELQNKLDNELSKHNKSGRKTAREKTMIKIITNKYDTPIKNYNDKINAMEKTSKAKYEKISRQIGVGESTIERYLTFMNNYINDRKYKKLFQK